MQPSILMSGCSACFLLVVNPTSFSGEPFWNVCLLTSSCTTRPRTAYLLKRFFKAVSFASPVNHVSSAFVLGEDYTILATRAAPNPSVQSQRSPTPGPHHHRPSAYSSANCSSDSPSLCWCHSSHGDQAEVQSPLFLVRNRVFVRKTFAKFLRNGTWVKFSTKKHHFGQNSVRAIFCFTVFAQLS